MTSPFPDDRLVQGPEFACRAVSGCRICGSDQLSMALDLGQMPLANAFLTTAEAARSEHRFPLQLLRCSTCGLIQLSVVIDPEILFRRYLYASSASAPMLDHFQSYADEIVDRFAPPGSLVVEIGSNDGVLLRPLAHRGAHVLGIEPSRNLSATANAAGLETWNEFFGPPISRTVVRTKGSAAAVVANNVLAHIDDLIGVADALDTLLAPDGVFVAEFPYLRDLLDHVEYDTIYHEHLSYFALTPLVRLFGRANLEPFDVRRLPIHGGSVRLFVGRRGRHTRTAELERLLEEEASDGLGSGSTYEDLAKRVEASRDALVALIDRERSRGFRIAGLGATAKGNTLLNFCGIGPDRVGWIGDSTPMKVGLFSPGMHIPIRDETAILAERPERVLLLAWNYADAIVQRLTTYVRDGGRFIHPIPIARLIP